MTIAQIATPEFGERLINLLSALLLATTFAIVGFRYIRTTIRSYAVHSALLAAVAFLVAIYSGNSYIYVAAVLTVAVKVIAVPIILGRAARKTGLRRDEDPVMTVPGAYIIAGLLIAFSYGVIRPLMPELGGWVFLARDSLAAGTAIILIGFFVMLIRKQALSQVIGLLTLENGIFLAALAATNGMPFVVEIGISFDAVVGVIILAMLTLQINDLFPTTDTVELSHLREGPPR